MMMGEIAGLSFSMVSDTPGPTYLFGFGCDMSVLECIGCMGSDLEVLHFCLWPRGEFLGARFWFVLVALLCLRFQTSSWLRARRFYRPRLPEPWIL